MAIIVQKYGGSSLASAEHIRNVANHIAARRANGEDLVVVVSAMGKTTDELTRLAREINPNPSKREMDMLLSVGERVSISLLAMALHEQKIEAKSFTGSQVGIITDTEHTRARILEIRANRIVEELNNGKVVIVAGFQGVSIQKEITTLGRGGSDTTAVALAAALKAERCELMKDIDGILQADPQIIPNPEVVQKISYEEMIEMASLDAGVLKAESVELARYYGVKIGLGSSASGNVGTIISDEPFAPDVVKTIALETDLGQYSFYAGQPALLASELMQRRIVMHDFKMNGPEISFFASGSYDTEIRGIAATLSNTNLTRDNLHAMISFVGEGIRPGTQAAEILFKMFADILGERYRAYASMRRISVFVEKEDAEKYMHIFIDYLRKNAANLLLTQDIARN
jgi:aspartate kinase